MDPDDVARIIYLLEKLRVGSLVALALLGLIAGSALVKR